MRQYIFETERLFLRPLAPEDAGELSKVLSDQEAMKYYPHPFSPEEVEHWIQWNIDNYEKYNHGLWAVIRKKDQVFLGDCGITMQDIDGEVVPEIGFHILPQYGRQGYATEAAKGCVKYAFDVLGYSRVFSYTDCANLPSQGVAKKLGMRFYKTFEKYNTTEVCCYLDKARNDYFRQMLL